MKEYELAWFYFPGLGRINKLEVDDNERIVAVLEQRQYEEEGPDSLALLCLVECIVEED